MGVDGNLVLTVPDVISERDTVRVHDTVINRIFGVGLVLAGVLSLEQVGDEVAHRLRAAIDALDTAVGELRIAALAEVVGDDAWAGAHRPLRLGAGREPSRCYDEGEPGRRVPSTVAGFD